MEDVVRIGLPLGECVGLQHRQSWLRFPPNTDEEVHSCWAISLNNIYLVIKDVKDTPWGLLRVYEDKFANTFMVDDEAFDSADNPAFIYASIIENSYINGKLSRNLGIVPIRYTSNWSLYEPTDPNYVPINVKEFSKILIEIRDMNGEYIKFNPKFKTVLNLKIKAIKRT